MDNPEKDIRTSASGVAGVGDSAKVYAVVKAIEFAEENDVKIPMMK